MLGVSSKLLLNRPTHKPQPHWEFQTVWQSSNEIFKLTIINQHLCETCVYTSVCASDPVYRRSRSVV